MAHLYNFLPWICDDNYDESYTRHRHSNADICFGHLEIKGFEMHSGHMNEHGLESETNLKDLKK